MSRSLSFFFFSNDTATTEIYTLSLHDALPICISSVYFDTAQFEVYHRTALDKRSKFRLRRYGAEPQVYRSEEHTSELQSRVDLVCRLLLEKKNQESK